MLYGDRVKKIRNAFNKNQTEFGKLLNVNQIKISRLENSQNESIDFDILNKLKDIGVNINWLLTGEGQMFADDIADENAVSLIVSNNTAMVAVDNINVEETIYIKKLDVKAAAGVGFINAERDSSVWIGLPESFIRPYNPRYISLLEATGASMEPVIRSGDLLLVSEQDTTLLSECIYIIRVGEELKVKRLIRQGNKNIVMWSENEAFGHEEFTPQQWEEYGMTIIARVVKIIKNV